MITIETKLARVGQWTIVRLPQSASAQLPSRGQTMVEGTINGRPLSTPLEPDGKLSHWFVVDAKLLKALGAQVGDTVTLKLEPSKHWPEPAVPADLQAALNRAEPKIQELWHTITPMARWEWIRWSRSTNSAETRAHRVEVAISKMRSGERRPCCWNRNLCTEPSVSKGGILFEPSV